MSTDRPNRPKSIDLFSTGRNPKPKKGAKDADVSEPDGGGDDVAVGTDESVVTVDATGPLVVEEKVADESIEDEDAPKEPVIEPKPKKKRGRPRKSAAALTEERVEPTSGLDDTLVESYYGLVFSQRG